MLVLVDGEDPDASTETLDLLRRTAERIRDLRLVGGTAAISPAGEDRLRAALEG